MKAFILLELCIALIVIGMVSGSLYPLLKAFSVQRQKEHIERIAYALAGYVSKNARLPCPGNKVENYPCMNASKGHLPYETLQIPEAWAKDAQGAWISYEVHPFLTLESLKMDYQGTQSLQGDHQTFCYTPLELGKLKSSEGIPIAVRLGDTWYPRDAFLSAYVKWTCKR